jgi:DNA-binding CsgD family transcriptional regulator
MAEASNENKKAYLYNQSVHDKLLGITEPILSSVNITSFRYFKILENGTYLNLSTHQEWLKKRLLIPDNGITFHNALRRAQVHKPYYYLWGTSLSDAISQLFYEFNIWNGFSIYKRFKEGVEVWSFGADRESTQMAQFYINNLDLLEEFTRYFSTKALDIIDASDSEKLAKFSQAINISPFSESFEENKLISLHKFLKSEFQNKIICPLSETGFVYLSRREEQCMECFSQGKTIKEVAKLLKLSPRTIESYLENIKKKMGCHFKSDAISLYLKSTKS